MLRRSDLSRAIGKRNLPFNPFQCISATRFGVTSNSMRPLPIMVYSGFACLTALIPYEVAPKKAVPKMAADAKSIKRFKIHRFPARQPSRKHFCTTQYPKKQMQSNPK